MSTSHQSPFKKLIGTFVAGWGLSSLLIFSIVTLSLFTTQSSWKTLDVTQWAIALLLPILCGTLAVLYPRPMTRIADAIADLTNALPF